ncbi:two-component regulator propeller domain-containing protein [uncultured Bacteroides sp.]|uniref:type IX secretion system anionic LPS delivery protein PorZ n=1 Tax=uncultured Bacteroides sp. TaxID=162156 RepID=UPI002AAB09D0|nr:two-component regulator propeller domain-containing protein [uncultured Bacteroides sp.]
MKKLIYSFLLFLITHSAFAQMAIGEWQAHLAYNNVTQTAPAGNLIYALSDGALFSYNKEDQSIRLFSKVNILSDNNISYIKYSNSHNTLIIIYKNSNIDLLINDNIYNIPDFMNKIISQDKTINSINISGDYAYLSTNFGILILNLKKKEITNTYVLNKKVYASVIKDNVLYAATEKGVYSGKTTDNLLDNNSWIQFSETVFNQLFLFENKLIGNQLNQGIYQYNYSSSTFTKLINGDYAFADLFDEKLISGNANSIVIFDHYNSFKYMNLEDSFSHLSYSKNDNYYWGSNGEKGLNGYKLNNDKLEKSISSITPDSPKRNLPYYMTFTNNRLLICGGGMNYIRLNNPGTIMMLEDNNWSSFQEKGIKDITGLDYKDITSVIQDPNDSEHHFATSGGEGVYEFKDKKFVKLYSINNSTLKSILPNESYRLNYVRTNGLQYDKNHNLWMVNSYVDNIINVLKDDGTWISFNHPELSGKPTFERIIFDKRGWAWVTSMRYEPGVFCFNTNGTLEDTTDDKTKFIGSFVNQDGTNLGKLNILSIAEDKNGAIWIGTEKGPIVINNPTKIFDDDFYCIQIKVPRNDGTNLADFLLDNEKINAICIDGANRKWIGTENNGIFLLSEDGLETIHHFSTSNSPLLSNKIQSLVINPNTGELYIGTDQGLISYMSDATEGGNSFSESAHAYPNPVKPDYTGVITVTGLIRDSDVKITDINGNLIYAGTSVGGQFTWNGANSKGKRVASGIYLVLAADSEGKEGIATKILVIK